MDANRGIGDIWVTLGPKGPALQGDEPEARQHLADDLDIKISKININSCGFYKINLIKSSIKNTTRIIFSFFFTYEYKVFLLPEYSVSSLSSAFLGFGRFLKSKSLFV